MVESLPIATESAVSTLAVDGSPGIMKLWLAVTLQVHEPSPALIQPLTDNSLSSAVDQYCPYWQVLSPSLRPNRRELMARPHAPRLKRPLDGQYFCTIFEVAQWYWTFVGTIERLCNIIDGIKTFWNILRNLKILCRLWVVLRNIPSILLFRFSLFCPSIDYEYKMWRKSICYWMYRTV